MKKKVCKYCKARIASRTITPLPFVTWLGVPVCDVCYAKMQRGESPR